MGTTAAALPADLPTALKILRVFDATDLDNFTYLTPEDYAKATVHVPSTDYYTDNELSGGTGGRYGKGNRVYTIEFAKVYAHYTTNSVRIVYIASPAWITTNLTIPTGWEGLVSSYCAIQALRKGGDVARAETLDKSMKQEMVRFTGFADTDQTAGG